MSRSTPASVSFSRSGLIRIPGFPFIVRAFLAAFALVLSSLLTVPVANAVEIKSMTYHDVDNWVAMSASKLRKTLANKTIRIQVTSRAVGDLKPVLGTGSLFLFTAPGGKLIWWTSKYKVLQTGKWSTMTLMKGWELPCFKFKSNAGLSECFFGGAANYKEWTAGNPFEFKAGEAPKVKLSSSASIGSVARKAGL